MRIISKKIPTIDFSSWLSTELLRETENWKKRIPFNEDAMGYLEKWVEETHPDLSKLNIHNAIEESVKWAQYKGELDLAKEYKFNDVVYEFKNGYKIVKIHPDDILNEKAIMDRQIGSYSTQTLRDQMRDGSCFIYSLRTPENIPKAYIEIMPQDEPHVVDISEIRGREDEINPNYHDKPLAIYQSLIKEWFNTLKSKGYELKPEPEEDDYEPTEFSNYICKEIQKAKTEQEAQNTQLQEKRKNLPRIDAISVKGCTMKPLRIIKLGQKQEDSNTPDPETLSLYVESLKIHLKDNKNLSQQFKEIIQNLPTPRTIRKDMSYEECKVLYETVEFLWKNITGNKIVSEKEIVKAPEKLSGNYWLLGKGILLSGLNHHGIIRQNCPLISSILNIGGITLQEHLAGEPNKLMKLIIKNDGIRMFVDKNKLWIQCNSKVYGDWVRKKIKDMDFKEKIVKIIDLKADYKGWISGISVRL
jgi:hypothetical protein